MTLRGNFCLVFVFAFVLVHETNAVEGNTQGINSDGHFQEARLFGADAAYGQHEPFTTRQKRGLLDKLALKGLVTQLLIFQLNNKVLAPLQLTVLVLPMPLPLKLAKCIPGCLDNPDCKGAITAPGTSSSGGADPLGGLLGGLGGLLGQ